ncbi:MAG TPA: serine/threonine-protein kinase [Pyrinomonadaceae bacterium]|nr:serine/threonine-protein kinase [Pyrinomonadaceae bacterium]
MNQERFKQIDSILDEVLEVTIVERERILDELCRDDAELKREVLKLLSSLNESDDFIEKTEFTPVKYFIEPQADEFIGKKIGAYSLKKLIGTGGMSAVYLASRIDDFEKEVAVKIIPPFENRKASAENFKRERQILARLEHPNIAQILDGGTTEGEKPYIVMEYVDGLPLNEFCVENNLNETQKLKLFQDVCHTVSFAHQNLIVHRDLKPNNILVTKNGKVKLLDFGIAKLLDAEGINFTENKTFDGNALTLEYASPEQINGENITVASDVYSLGVILYELLTGKRPHYFKDKSLNEILDIIKTKEPVAPSAISDSKIQISDSELDLIVLNALCKDVSERYQTVSELSADVNNYLENLPISVRPQTNFYSFKKYIQRHRIESAVALLVSFLVIGWLITFAWQFRNEQFLARENRRAAYSAEMILAANEYEHANLNRLKELVEKYEPADGEDDLRGFEWYFLKNLLEPPTKIGTFRHADEVWNAEFSPDGKFIVTACNDNFVRIWNVETGEMKQTEEQKGAWKIAFFPDGKSFAVASSSNSAPMVKIYETATAKEIKTIKGHTKRIRAVDISPDGKFLATGSMDGDLVIWDAQNFTELHRFSFSTPEKGVELTDVQFSKNGDKLAVLGFETLAFYDTKTWLKKQADNGYYQEKNAQLNGWKVVFSPLEKTLAIGTFNGDVVFVDVDTFEVLKVLPIHQANVKSLAFSADGKILVTGSGDRTVKFVDVATGEVVNELRGHFSGVHEVVFSPDWKKMATASADFNLNFWDTEKVSNNNSILTNSPILTVSNKDNKGFAWNLNEQDANGWDFEKKKKIWSSKTKISPYMVSYSPDKKLVGFGERDGFISIFNSENGNEFRRIKVADKNIYSFAFTPDGAEYLAGTEDGMLKYFETDSGKEIYSIKAAADIVKTVAFSPDGKLFATGSNDKLVKLFNAENGAEIAVLTGNTKPLYKVTFSPDGKTVAAVGADDKVRIWNVSDKKQIHEFSGMSAGIYAVAFTSDGKRLATASDVGVIRLWNTETGEQVLAFTGSRKQINYLKFIDDGKTLVSGDNGGKVSFWFGN